MGTNLLKALLNIKQAKNLSLPSYFGLSNRINSVGTALEYFVKDAFCFSFSIKSVPSKEKEYSKYLSHLGDINHPPDFIIRNGDAVEVKKISKPNAGLALNTSYPKNKLFSDSPLITESCRLCENWSKKDIIYAVGVVNDGKLETLWFVYGDCYAADREIYERIRKTIISGVNVIEGIEFSKTRELAHVNKVDPLGITYLRVRGMWGIENPAKVFGSSSGIKKKSFAIAIMKAEKYESFTAEDRSKIEECASVTDAEIKDPNNPAKFIKAKRIEL